jgi:Flp pilus assembly pilin Flp
MRKLRAIFVRCWRGKDGAAGVEYALIVAIICCGIAVGTGMLADSIGETVRQMAACITEPLACVG